MMVLETLTNTIPHRHNNRLVKLYVSELPELFPEDKELCRLCFDAVKEGDDAAYTKILVRVWGLLNKLTTEVWDELDQNSN